MCSTTCWCSFLHQNQEFVWKFPGFKQNNTRLACFGPTTQKAENNGLIVDIPAPTPDAPSMTKAISDYMKVANKK